SSHLNACATQICFERARCTTIRLWLAWFRSIDEIKRQKSISHHPSFTREIREQRWPASRLSVRLAYLFSE
ncbi:hypothetical protein CHS0354_041097, partial [Potamilus streckersoni]